MLILLEHLIPIIKNKTNTSIASLGSTIKKKCLKRKRRIEIELNQSKNIKQSNESEEITWTTASTKIVHI